MLPPDRLNKTLRFIERFIPKRLFRLGQPFYHFLLAFLGALLYRLPSRKLHAVAVTGTKGKTSVTEFLYAIFRADGKKAAVTNTIRFVMGDAETRNMTKTGLPGRFFLQRFLRKAVNAECSHAVVEVSSEAARQYRHRFVSWDGFIFTNITLEHIESHGSFEKYKQAKLAIGKSVARSPKKTTLVVNAQSTMRAELEKMPFGHKTVFDIKDARNLKLAERESSFLFLGEHITLHIPGEVVVENALAAGMYAHELGIPTETIKRGLESVARIPGRLEFIDEGQDFDVVVDYAHTTESLEALYKTFGNKRKICVLGNAGGGRDTWKRPEMAKIADRYCDRIILTNEDPYDENPQKIVEEMRAAITKTDTETTLDRREAIRAALSGAKTGDAVLITGKGTDPYIMGPRNSKTPWSDAHVTREELKKTK